MNEIRISAELLALRMLCTFLLSREMARAGSALPEIHEALIQQVISAIPRDATGPSVTQGELEAAFSSEIDQAFVLAYRMSEQAQR